ncbi:chemosensory protein 1 [Ptiloglossa arizonensis]|uniref:chemosensory protein 1 n=1 Tax=Ptiloglossa arizonensis TaxID=3350558 RepID=UPI003F9EE854
MQICGGRMFPTWCLRQKRLICSFEKKRLVTFDVMRYYSVLLLLSLLAWTYAEEFYSDKYDDIDIVTLLENDRMREQYYNCFMNTGPCVTADAKFFKENLPEAVTTNCKKCTEKQKENFNTIADWFNKNQPEKWTAFVEYMLKSMKEA